MIYQPSFFEKKINEEIANLTFKKSPKNLFKPIKYILSLGGKRVRPVLALMSTNLFSDEIEQTIAPAIGIEIFHNFSLLHDDVMDKSDLRRGKATVHKKWNENVAILSGDAMLIEAYKHVSCVPEKYLSDILTIFSETAMEVCEGQQLDMDFETRFDVKKSEYIEMIRLKTAVLLACALKIGAILGGAFPEEADYLYQFGINMGIAFQLKDDLLDVYGDPKKFGKKIGGDILNNKKTWLLISALKKADANQEKILMRWLEAENFDPKEKIDAVKKIYDALKLKKAAEKQIEKYYLEALDCLSQVNVADDRKTELMILSENLMYREK